MASPKKTYKRSRTYKRGMSNRKTYKRGMSNSKTYKRHSNKPRRTIKVDIDYDEWKLDLQGKI